MQVTQCDHGHTRAHESVIGVIPFGALGIHPNATPGDKVGELGKRRHEQFL